MLSYSHRFDVDSRIIIIECWTVPARVVRSPAGGGPGTGEGSIRGAGKGGFR